MVVCYLVIRISVSFQLVSNGIVFVGVNIAGIFLHNVTDRAQRKTFIDTRNCIAARLEIQDENDKLVCTAACTPQHSLYVLQHAHPNTGFAAPFSKAVLGSVLLKHWLSGFLPPKWFKSLCCQSIGFPALCCHSTGFPAPFPPKVVLEFVLSPHWLSSRLPPKWFWSLCCQSTGFPVPLQSGFRVCVVKVLDFRL